MTDYNPSIIEEIKGVYEALRKEARDVKKRKGTYWTAQQQAHHERYAGRKEDRKRFAGEDERFALKRTYETIRKKTRKKALEERLGVIITFLVFGIALIFGSLTLTGNAVSNLTQTAPGLLGLALSAAGITGMLFYLGRNRK